ncbi:hypothetical protein [Pseudomonas sp. nanlin1]|uniref:hypothetical protein n=1 Tax=Pseudomonas sp. nanlin1 TaxID=3040605 RepID=UPI00388DC70D
MNYSFSIKLTNHSPESLTVDVYDQSPTELTEQFIAYNFNVDEGHAIRFGDLPSGAQVIIENTGTQPFVWEDSQPRIRLHLKPGQRKQVNIAAGDYALYPYPETRGARASYFETKEVEIFDRSVICLFYVGTRSEAVPYNATIETHLRQILKAVNVDYEPHKEPSCILKTLPVDKAEFFALHYSPAEYLMRFYENIATNVERGNLVFSGPSLAGHSRMTGKQVSSLAAPVPAQHFTEKGIEPPGYFVGFQYLVVKPGDERMKDVDFYVAAPPEQ